MKTIRQKAKSPPILSIKFLEKLGYRLGEIGAEHPEDRMKLYALERIDNGSVADFCFCSDSTGTVGVIWPGEMKYHLERMAQEG